VADRRRGRGQTTGAGRVRPYIACVVLRVRLAINLNESSFDRCRMIVLEGGNRRRRVEHDIPFTKETPPLLPEPCAHYVGQEPITVARDHAAGSLGLSGVPELQPHVAPQRNEPPMSEPNDKGLNPAARAAADPPEDPPGARLTSQGLFVVP
jgi:hypothetical protein